MKCLKPGGMLILIEGDFELYQMNQANYAVPVEPNCTNAMQPGKSWLTHILFGAHRSPLNVDRHHPLISYLVNSSHKRVSKGSVYTWRRHHAGPAAHRSRNVGPPQHRPRQLWGHVYIHPRRPVASECVLILQILLSRIHTRCLNYGTNVLNRRKP